MSPAPPARTDAPETGLEPGDRFEVARVGPGDRLRLPKVLGPSGFAIERVEDQGGLPMELTRDPAGHPLVVAQPGQLLPDPPAALWLEYQAPGRFRLVAEPGAPATANGELTTEQGIKIALDAYDGKLLLDGS
ncbi:MAG: hypothetical protein ACM35G_10630, partial [Planctomycetaceae bacterium]